MRAAVHAFQVESPQVADFKRTIDMLTDKVDKLEKLVAVKDKKIDALIAKLDGHKSKTASS